MLFDLDGTLVDTAPDLAAAVQGMLRDLARPPVDQATVEGWIGDGVARLVKRALTGRRDGEPEAALFERAHARFLERYGRDVSQRSRPYPGAREALAALRGIGVPLACVTSKLERFVVPLLDDLDLLRCFAVVVAGDTLERRKPDPLPVLHTCAQLGVAPADALLVGDSIADARAARAAGVRFAAVTYGYHGAHPPLILGATLLLDSLVDLLPAVAEDAGWPDASLPDGEPR